MPVAVLILILIIALVITWWLVQTLIGLVLMLVIAALCSAAAQAIVKYRDGGFRFTLLSGVIGAVVGIVLAKLLGLPTFPQIQGLPLVWTLVGSLIVVAGAKLALPRRRTRVGRRDTGFLR